MSRWREARFDDAESLEAAVDAYFRDCEVHGKKATVPGLALALGFASKQSLYDYRDLDDHRSYPIKRALLRLESQRNEQALELPAGVIFDLKNHHGWKDKTETELSGPNGGPLPMVEVVFRKPSDNK